MTSTHSGFSPAEMEALNAFVRERADADAVDISEPVKLSGGAIQENWLLALLIRGGPLQGHHEWVLRRDARSGISQSHGRASEFALLKVAFEAGVTVPQPLWLCTDMHVIGSPFFLMHRVGGMAAGHRIVKQQAEATTPTGVAERLGIELARIHTIRPPRHDLPFLAPVAMTPALDLSASLRRELDAHALPRPALEWGLSWLEHHAPETREIVLCHRDFRTGNYMMDGNRLTAIIDWEFAGWGDAMEDLGWFCARCWRFGQPTREAGGVGSREDFYRGYESVGGVRPDPDIVRYWEVMAHVRWALIALQQARRASVAEPESLVLALTGHIVPELELEILRMTPVAGDAPAMDRTARGERYA